MKLRLHIGQQKTGSTSLQRFLFDNYDNLLKKNVLYPKSLGTEHFKQHLVFRHHETILDGKLSKKLQEEIDLTKPDSVIISDENLFYGRNLNKSNLATFFTHLFSEIEVIVYLRRQDLHMPSHYQQALKGKVTRTFDEWIDNSINKGYYDYGYVLNLWRQHLPQSKFTIKVMHNLVQDDIRFDFMSLLNVNTERFIFNQKHSLNESIDWRLLPAMLCCNKLYTKGYAIERVRELKDDFLNFTLSNEKIKKLKFGHEQYMSTLPIIYNFNKKLIKEFNLNDKQAAYLLPKSVTYKHHNFDLSYCNTYLFSYLQAYCKKQNLLFNKELDILFKNLDPSLNHSSPDQSLTAIMKIFILILEKAP